MPFSETQRYIVTEVPSTIMGIHIQQVFSVTTNSRKEAAEYEITLWGQPDSNGSGRELLTQMAQWGAHAHSYGKGPDAQVNARVTLKKREGVLGFLRVLQTGGHITSLQIEEIKRQFGIDRQAERGGNLSE